MSISSSVKGMVFLETNHPIIEDTLLEKLAPGAKQEPCDITCSDFDDVRYRIVVTSDAKNILNFQLAMPYLKDLNQMGASSVIDGLYGKYKSSGKEPGYDLFFKIDVNNQKDSAETVAKIFSEIKRNLLAVPFTRCFEALQKGSGGGKPMVIPFRPHERMVLVPGSASDRVLVYFSIYFSDETDRALAKVFLQEFSESQRKVPQAPSVAFTQDCPSDLAKVREFKQDKDVVGYIQFQIFKAHVEGAKLDKIVTLFTGFRSYLHYHIKASKAHLHSRMRNRVDLLLKVLKRADPTLHEDTGKKAYRTY